MTEVNCDVMDPANPTKKYLTPKVKTYVIQLDVNFPSNSIT